MTKTLPRLSNRLTGQVLVFVLSASVGAGGLLWACTRAAMEPVGTETHRPFLYGDRPSVEELASLGRMIFLDASLSASGKLACATCHDPAQSFGPPDAEMTRPGGPGLDRLGFRNTPSLCYVHSPIAFTEHFFETEVTFGKDDQGPTGGRTWDGRVNTAHDQALMPLLDPNEMANASLEEVVQRLKGAEYAEAFRQAVSPPGKDIFEDPRSAAVWLAVAVETYEIRGPEFHLFNSKFDAYLRDEVELSSSERHGMELFNDMKKGNCGSCHVSTMKSSASQPPIFTDFGYAALAVPRNRKTPVTQDPAFFDLGLCGPLRSDLGEHPEYCGMFRVPSLRNVARRKSFFHNGAVHTLREAVEFYVTRDTDPKHWYPLSSRGRPEFDDLPEKYRGNVHTDIPFKPLPDGKPRLTPAEIDDVVAFLETLSDGFVRPRRNEDEQVIVPAR